MNISKSTAENGRQIGLALEKDTELGDAAEDTVRLVRAVSITIHINSNFK